MLVDNHLINFYLALWGRSSCDVTHISHCALDDCVLWNCLLRKQITAQESWTSQNHIEDVRLTWILRILFIVFVVSYSTLGPMSSSSLTKTQYTVIQVMTQPTMRDSCRKIQTIAHVLKKHHLGTEVEWFFSSFFFPGYRNRVESLRAEVCNDYNLGPAVILVQCEH